MENTWPGFQHVPVLYSGQTSTVSVGTLFHGAQRRLQTPSQHISRRSLRSVSIGLGDETLCLPEFIHNHRQELFAKFPLARTLKGPQVAPPHRNEGRMRMGGVELDGGTWAKESQGLSLVLPRPDLRLDVSLLTWPPAAASTACVQSSLGLFPWLDRAAGSGGWGARPPEDRQRAELCPWCHIAGPCPQVVGPLATPLPKSPLA